MVPLVGISSVPRMCSSVLLPQPLGPTIASVSPAETCRLTPLRTWSGSPRVGKSLVRSESSSLDIVQTLLLVVVGSRDQGTRTDPVERVLDIHLLVPGGAEKSPAGLLQRSSVP